MKKLVLHMVGNAHLDPVWLWQWPAGVDEALATFRSAADRCDEYPEFIYTRGEAWLYHWVEKLDPVLFARVERLVASGQWHVTGGQCIQPDANLPTVMGWKRQFAHGQRYFQTRFGIKPNVGYNVDNYGHPGTLPDILAPLGVDAYIFHRPSAAQWALPATTFRWRGTGGTEILGHRHPSAYATRTDDLYGQIKIVLDSSNFEFGHALCFYGVGNHGGGPTKGNIEYILEHRDAFEGVRLEFSTPQRFFAAAHQHRDRLSVVDGEIQRTFPGSYSVMHDVKQAQVRGEHRLDQTERLIRALEPDADRRTAQLERLDGAWDDLLFTEFHDILGGSCVRSAWPGVRAIQGRARAVAEELMVETTRSWARRELPTVNHQQIVLLNPDEAAFAGCIEHEPSLDFDLWRGRWLSDLEGNPIPHQLIQPEGCIELTNRVLFPAQIAAGGWLGVLVRDDAPPTAVPLEAQVSASPTRLANQHLELNLDAHGIAALRLNGQSLLGAEGISLHLRRDSTDTWTFNFDHFGEAIEERLSGSWVVDESGPLRASVRMETTLGNSRVRWTISLCEGNRHVSMRLEVLWTERLRILQLPIDLLEAPVSWQDGQAGGHVVRTPSATEWPVQGWSRVSQSGGDLSVVTVDAYSLSLNDTCWQWTLLRSPKMAWSGSRPDVYVGRDDHADQGEQTFDLTLGVGAEEGDLTVRARQMAQPPIIMDRYEGMNRPPWGNHPPNRLWTGGEARARRDGMRDDLIDDGSPGFGVPPKSED